MKLKNLLDLVWLPVRLVQVLYVFVVLVCLALLSGTYALLCRTLMGASSMKVRQFLDISMPDFPDTLRLTRDYLRLGSAARALTYIPKVVLKLTLWLLVEALLVVFIFTIMVPLLLIAMTLSYIEPSTRNKTEFYRALDTVEEALGEYANAKRIKDTIKRILK